MWAVEDHFRVVIGGNTYIGVPNLVAYKGQTLFTMKRADNGELGIYFELYDANGAHIASVKRNQIYPSAGQKELYSIEGTADEFVWMEFGKISGRTRELKRPESSTMSSGESTRGNSI